MAHDKERRPLVSSRLRSSAPPLTTDTKHENPLALRGLWRGTKHSSKLFYPSTSPMTHSNAPMSLTSSHSHGLCSLSFPRGYVCFGSVWYGLVRYWYGVVWCGVVRECVCVCLEWIRYAAQLQDEATGPSQCHPQSSHIIWSGPQRAFPRAFFFFAPCCVASFFCPCSRPVAAAEPLSNRDHPPPSLFPSRPGLVWGSRRYLIGQPLRNHSTSCLPPPKLPTSSHSVSFPTFAVSFSLPPISRSLSNGDRPLVALIRPIRYSPPP